ncbi:hypothetical protein LP416_28025 [Polaromonas sp. P2-4]|nr:hypothetical protein LP416_28025 [Polaromonas sp. P2-4]
MSEAMRCQTKKCFHQKHLDLSKAEVGRMSKAMCGGDGADTVQGYVRPSA